MRLGAANLILLIFVYVLFTSSMFRRLPCEQAPYASSASSTRKEQQKMEQVMYDLTLMAVDFVSVLSSPKHSSARMYGFALFC